MAVKRRFYRCAKGADDAVPASSPEDARLVSSRLSDRRWHAPAIDIDDIDVHVVRSRTPGSFHLFLEKPMRWWRYRLLLWAFMVAGIIEPGFYRMSVARRASFLRVPTRSRGRPESANPRARRYDNADVRGDAGSWGKDGSGEDKTPDLTTTPGLTRDRGIW